MTRRLSRVEFKISLGLEIVREPRENPGFAGGTRSIH